MADSELHYEYTCIYGAFMTQNIFGKILTFFRLGWFRFFLNVSIIFKWLYVKKLSTKCMYIREWFYDICGFNQIYIEPIKTLPHSKKYWNDAPALIPFDLRSSRKTNSSPSLSVFSSFLPIGSCVYCFILSTHSLSTVDVVYRMVYFPIDSLQSLHLSMCHFSAKYVQLMLIFCSSFLSWYMAFRTNVRVFHYVVFSIFQYILYTAKPLTDIFI